MVLQLTPLSLYHALSKNILLQEPWDESGLWSLYVSLAGTNLSQGMFWNNQTLKATSTNILSKQCMLHLLGLIVTRAYLFADLDLSVQCRSPKVPPKFQSWSLDSWTWSSVLRYVLLKRLQSSYFWKHETIPPPINSTLVVEFPVFFSLSFTYKMKNIATPKHGAVHCKKKKKKKFRENDSINFFQTFDTVTELRWLRRHATGVN